MSTKLKQILILWTVIVVGVGSLIMFGASKNDEQTTKEAMATMIYGKAKIDKESLKADPTPPVVQESQ